MDLGLQGARAVISGGSQGIRLAVAKALLAEGAAVQIAARSETFDKADLLSKLHAVKVPAGPIHNVDEALTSDQAVARQSVVTLPTPGTQEGTMRLLANPLKLSRTPVQYRYAPPRFGQDTREVLQQFGLDGKTD